MREGLVCIDATSRDEVFRAVWDDSRRWNGWLSPIFTFAEAERVVAWVEDGNEDSPRFLWTVDRQGFACLIQIEVDAWGEQYEQVETFVGDALVGFSIGANGWCWRELEEQDDEGLDARLRARHARLQRICDFQNGALRAAYELHAPDPSGLASRLTLEFEARTWTEAGQ